MGNDIGTSRREFVAAMGASVAAASAIATSTESAAQNTTPLKIVDFHNHFMGSSLTLTNLASVPPAARPTWEKINSNLQSQSALLASIEFAGIAARVINSPTAFIEDADGKVPPGAEQRINDQMAELCAKHPESFTALRPSMHSRAIRARASLRGRSRSLACAAYSLKVRGAIFCSVQRVAADARRRGRPRRARVCASADRPRTAQAIFQDRPDRGAACEGHRQQRRTDQHAGERRVRRDP